MTDLQHLLDNIVGILVLSHHLQGARVRSSPLGITYHLLDQSLHSTRAQMS